jgi:uncharacterized protein (UPF0333 family)
MFRRNQKNRSRGQTALEYMLVVGVIVVVVIIAGKKLFLEKESPGSALMSNAIQKAGEQITGEQGR